MNNKHHKASVKSVSVSVIIPMYNSCDYIKNALDCLMAQSLKNIEIICVDDGSTDDSGLIIKNYIEKDSRIIYLSQKNSGPGVARNHGMQYAKGEYLAFLDSDDEYPDTKTLEILYTKAKTHNANICGGSVCGVWCRGMDDTVFYEEGFQKFVDYQNDYMFWRFIYRRKFLEDQLIHFPSYRFYEDPVFLLEAMDKAQVFFALPELSYRKNAGHINSRARTKTEAVHCLLGIENNIRLALQKEYHIVYNRNLIALCGISNRLTVMIHDEQADCELINPLLQIIALVHIFKIFPNNQIKVLNTIRILLLSLLGRCKKRKRYLLSKFVQVSVAYCLVRVRNKVKRIINCFDSML